MESISFTDESTFEIDNHVNLQNDQRYGIPVQKGGYGRDPAHIATTKKFPVKVMVLAGMCCEGFHGLKWNYIKDNLGAEVMKRQTGVDINVDENKFPVKVMVLAGMCHGGFFGLKWNYIRIIDMDEKKFPVKVMVLWHETVLRNHNCLPIHKEQNTRHNPSQFCHTIILETCFTML